MKELLTKQGLTATHYDNGSGNHILEFDACCMKIFVTVHGIGLVDNQHYWDDERIACAVLEAAPEDIEVHVITGGKAVKVVDTDAGISWEVINNEATSH